MYIFLGETSGLQNRQTELSRSDVLLLLLLLFRLPTSSQHHVPRIYGTNLTHSRTGLKTHFAISTSIESYRSTVSSDSFRSDQCPLNCLLETLSQLRSPGRNDSQSLQFTQPESISSKDGIDFQRKRRLKAFVPTETIHITLQETQCMY